MESLTDLVASVPQGVQWALAGIGALYLGSKALNCLSLVLNVFLLSGTSVRIDSSSLQPTFCLGCAPANGFFV